MYSFHSNPKRIIIPFLLFFCIAINNIFAQEPSFGGGIGINSLRLVADNKEGATTRFSPTQVSLNIDYNFPNQTNIKWLQKIYNPIFGNNKLQLRGQAMINQFRIKVGLDNSITTLGASLLYFPWVQDPQKRTNTFVELGYKGGFSNISNDPFHGFVIGVGSRYNVGNDWFIQLNISYTTAFNDYLDRMGIRGLSWSNRDDYFLANVSLLKSFHTQTVKKQVDLARDSLAMAKTLASNVSQKSNSLLERIKLFNIQLQEKEAKAKNAFETANNLEEALKDIASKLQTIQNNKTNTQLSEAIAQETEALKTQFSILDLHSFFEQEALNNEFSVNLKNNIDVFYNDIQQDITITKQLLWQTKAFVPTNKLLKEEISNLFVINEANMLLEKCDNEVILMQKRIEERQNLLKKIVAIFEKVNINRKSVGQNLEQFFQEVQNAKSGY